MKATTVSIVLLVSALVASNAWWLYVVLDMAHAASDQASSLAWSNEALAQALAVIKTQTDADVTRDEIVAAAVQSAKSPREPFEKEGLLYVSALALRFSDTGHLVEAAPSWSPFP